MAAFFEELDGHNRYGVPRVGAPTAGSIGPGLERSAGPSREELPPPWDPDNPLFWVAAILAATFGLAGVSVRVRGGPARASAELGNT